MTSGHEKGSEFERRISTALSLWITGGVNKRVLWRTPGSGGMAHRLAKEQAKWIGGDIGVLDKDCEVACRFVTLFHTELKHYKTLSWHQMITVARKGFLWDVWWKTATLAELETRIPLVIAKQNHHPATVLTTPELLHKCHIPFVSFFGLVAATPLDGFLQFHPDSIFQIAQSILHDNPTPRPRIAQRQLTTTHS